MSIITFSNRDKREVGQTLSVAAIATCMAIEHNYKILLISTDFDDKSLENCFFKTSKVTNTINSIFQKRGGNLDVASGVEGLIRLFASNRVQIDMLDSYTRPILKDRLDILPSPKTKDIKEYSRLSTYFSQIAEVAGRVYDVVLIDLSKFIPTENMKKVYDLSSLVVMGIAQNQDSINDFMTLKASNEFYSKNSVMINIGKYNEYSRFTAKNIGRELKESITPFVVPYNIHFSDNCSDTTLVDYILKVQKLTFKDGDDRKFYQALKDTTERIDYERTSFEYGLK